MPNIAQVRRLNYNGEDIGMGFNSDTGLAVGTALDFTPPGDVLAQEAQSDVMIVTSHEELMSTLNMSAQLEGRYAFASGGTKVSFSKNTKYNSASTFVVARMVITNTVTRGRDFRLKPDLERLLAPGQFENFERAFGDSFVRAHYRGGEFYAVMRITSIDSRTESNLAVSLHAAVQGLIAGAEFQAQYDRANTSAKTKSEFSVSYYQKGGAGQDEIGTTLDVEEIKRRLRAFPDAVRNHPFPYFIEVATYDTVPIPAPGKEQKEAFLTALADADAKKLKYLQLKNDCEFAAEKPEFFYEPPSKAVLLADAAIYTRLANAAINHAVKLSDGTINPPVLFDPSQLTPRTVEPDLVLRKRDVGLESGFADWWTTMDNPATRKNDRDLVMDIGNLAIPEINNFNDIVDPSRDPVKTQRLRGEALARIVASFQEYSWDHAGIHASNRGPLTSLDALPTMLPKTIKSLEFPQNEIGSTKGLDQFLALVSLDLSHNAIASIGELAALPALRELVLVNNRIADLVPLRACASLETLDISGNDVTDLSPLAACSRLRNLTIEGTRLIKNGVTSRWRNAIVTTAGLADVPGLANPFLIGKVLQVRLGVLSQGAAAQLTGTATRVGDSNAFKVHLTGGAQPVEDVWTLRSIGAVRPLSDPLELMFAALVPDAATSDFPLSGVQISITRASMGEKMDLNYSYVDPADPRRCGIDTALYPAFATKFKALTFDAVVVS